MATDKLNPNEFGIKLYNRFPPSYRLDDAEQKYALRRYIETAADGGFKYAIEEQNGLLDLVNPQEAPLQVIYFLYKQYGFDLSHGIPEEFLRAFLPSLGYAWSKKGSLDVIEYIVSSLSGIKTSTTISYDQFGYPILYVRLEMDYNISDYFPDAKQFNGILEKFVPFYCDTCMMYVYVFYESAYIGMDESFDYMAITDTKQDDTYIENSDDITDNVHVLNVESSGVIGDDNLNSLLNGSTLLNNGFMLNGFGCYAIVTKNGVQEFLFT